MLEEHGANVALLRRREAEIADVERREVEARTVVEGLEAEIRASKEKVSRREQQAMLAEREVGFLQALVVSVPIVPSVLLFSWFSGKLYGGRRQSRRYEC